LDQRDPCTYLQEILVAVWQIDPTVHCTTGAVPPNSDVQIYPSQVPVFVWHPRLQHDFALPSIC
jgi:hypothetical protein